MLTHIKVIRTFLSQIVILQGFMVLLNMKYNDLDFQRNKFFLFFFETPTPKIEMVSTPKERQT